MQKKAQEEFVPTKYMWVCVHNKSYEERRLATKSSAFHDIESVDEDARNFRKGV